MDKQQNKNAIIDRLFLSNILLYNIVIFVGNINCNTGPLFLFPLKTSIEKSVPCGQRMSVNFRGFK